MFMRSDPFEQFDRLTRPERQILAMDAVRSGDEVLVYLDVPGVAREDIDVTVERNQIEVTAHRKWEPGGDERILASERRQGTFTRQLVVGDNLATGQLRAKLENGVLVLAIPVAEEAKPKSIQVTETSGGGEIETS